MALEHIIGTLKGILTLDTSGFTKGAKDATKTTEGLNTTLTNAAAQVYLLKQGFDVAKQAVMLYTDAVEEKYGAIDRFVQMTGASVDEAARWEEVFSQMGMDMTDLALAMKNLSVNAQEAMANGKSGAAEAFKTLGINVADSNGKIKSANTLLIETISALQRTEAGTLRVALAQDTMGKSAYSLNKILDDKTDIVQRLGDAEVDVNNRTMQSYKEYTASVNKLNDSFGDMAASVGIKIIPGLQILADFLTTRIIPAINTVLDHITGMGRVFGNIFCDMMMMVADANDYMASTPLGQYLGMKTVNRAPITNYRNSLNNMAGSGGVGSQAITTGPAAASQGTYMDRYSNDSGKTYRSPDGTLTTYRGPGTTQGSAAAAAGSGGITANPASTDPYAWNQFANGGVNYDAINPASGAQTGWGPMWGQAGMAYDVSRLTPMLKMNISSSARSKLNNYMSLNPWDRQQMGNAKRQSLYEDLRQEYDILTGGANPAYTAAGDAIIYVQIDGQTLAKAVVDKLRLLGVKG